MNYLWTDGVTPKSFPPLQGDQTTDVLIIGGGMLGVLCAMYLEAAGIDYLLVEGKTIGNGITKGTTAVLTAQHDTLYTDIIKKFGRQKAKLYLDSNLAALSQFKRLAQKIPCDFEEVPSVMYSRFDSTQLKQEAEAVCSLGLQVQFTTDTPLPFPVAGAVRYPGMAQFHPLKFLYGLASGLNIAEHTFVRHLDGTTAWTNTGKIQAQRVIVATHFPMLNRHGLYPIKLYQKRSYVQVIDPGPHLGCTMTDTAESGIYLRNYGNLLLVGGGDHRTGSSGQGFAAPDNFIRQYYPRAKIKYSWANQDCISLDGIPYIGRYSPSLPQVYLASGFNEWGMTTSMLAAKLLTDMICNKPNPTSAVFDPDRSILSSQLLLNLGVSLSNYLCPTTKRCSHLGCALKWNPIEHSWDCPCHGSRFDAQGKLIDNPAMKDSRI